MGELTPWWETLPLKQLDAAQWELLCDGCGKCCLHKLEDEDTGDYYPTNVACRQLDRRTAQCRDYANRKMLVPDCIQLRLDNLEEFDWLPRTCGYRLRAEGKPLPEWHHLNTGSRESVHEAGASTRGWTISEVDAGDLEDHMVTDRDV
ncbi:UPF0260 protein CJA_2436 [Sphingomonas antarctica]|uniref:YcgN family cysteine cluster protein n=1 Tax=Sphingomonas antarctica TaxID=2040274 RepID=UPI0039EA6C04